VIEHKNVSKLVQTQAKPRIVRIEEPTADKARQKLEIPTALEITLPLDHQNTTRLKRTSDDSHLHELLNLSEQKRKESLHKITDLQGRLQEIEIENSRLRARF
jgi:hypothetical protein